ncbi:DUF551 domain-containing protein [Klebsiella pneumoniae]|uniref:DUF551 domain-containing protein n=1 Tax=Klebsiella pneumoniae TaxID=573 RepID=UPI003F860F1C
MDSEPVELPLDYLQGHKDGLEWASQLAEANHPETGDWLYDDPIELAKAIRKGPDMPPVQPVADSEPVAEITEDLGRLFVKIHYPTTLKAGDKLYRHAQPAPVVEREPIAWLNDAYLARGVVDGEVGSEDAGPGYIPVYREAGPQPAPVVPEEKPIPNTLSMYAVDAVAAIAEVKGWNACRAAMLKENPVCTCPSGDGSLRWPCPVHPGNSPAQSDCCPAQNHVSPEQNGDTPAQSQGWIQVSEQMPPSRHEVLVGCWWGGKPRWCCKWATYIPGHPDAQSSGWLIPGASWTPTHWMQLPAGPQEVKSES